MSVGVVLVLMLKLHPCQCVMESLVDARGFITQCTTCTQMAMLMSATDWPRLGSRRFRGVLGMAGLTVRPLAFRDSAITGCCCCWGCCCCCGCCGEEVRSADEAGAGGAVSASMFVWCLCACEWLGCGTSQTRSIRKQQEDANHKKTFETRPPEPRAQRVQRSSECQHQCCCLACV